MLLLATHPLIGLYVITVKGPSSCVFLLGHKQNRGLKKRKENM